MTQTGQSASAAGYLKWQVIDGATGQVVRDSGPEWIRNLILNTGLNAVAVRAWVVCFEYAICGTGVRPTSVDSLTVNATLSSGTITADASFFDGSDVGAELKWDDGTRALITSYASPTTVVTDATGSATGHFVKYNTQDTSLQIETKRTTTKLTGAGNCGTTTDGAQMQFRRTFDFTVESVPQNYTEVGFSWVATGANTTFSRILLPSAVPVGVGQQLRVTYELRVTLTPSLPVSRTAAISGWSNTSGVEQTQMVFFGTVDTLGASQTGGAGTLASEPFDFGGAFWNAFLSPEYSPPAAFESAVNRSTGAGYGDSVTRSAYAANSFYVDATAVFNVGTANRTDLRSFGYGFHNPNSYFASIQTAYVFVMANNQTKDNAHTLTLTFRMSWSRDLA